ncbi:MAG: hypothetical protein BWY15_00630 [Firmicutes bacterium ADurb.Bin193]|nr:MAG: hypothetical protein BWY15_00630 [Firmicutes bacterium ADurb.Bin193]
MNENERPLIPKSQLIFGAFVHWITIASCILSLFAPVVMLLAPKATLMNQNLLFGAIFSGETPKEIWARLPGGFPGGHFYLNNILTGDGLGQFAIALGCSVSVWALIAAIIMFIKEKNYLFVGISLFVMLLTVFAMSGFVNIE